MRHTRAIGCQRYPGRNGTDVDRDDPLDPLGRALREREPDRAPVVHHEPDAVEPRVRGEALEPVGVARDRVVEVAALRAAAEAGQVGRDAAGALEERRPTGRRRPARRGGTARGGSPPGALRQTTGRPSSSSLWMVITGGASCRAGTNRGHREEVRTAAARSVAATSRIPRQSRNGALRCVLTPHTGVEPQRTRPRHSAPSLNARSSSLRCDPVPTVPRRDWTPPSRRRVLALRDRLRLVYGRPFAPPHRRPLDELILTVLSQSTNDRNRDVAFLRLRARFPSWAAVRDAPHDEVEEAIRPGRDLQGQVGADPGDPARARRPALARPPRGAGRRGGARRARARCPASAARRRPACSSSPSACADVPVDTHVSRVGTRLGLFRPGAPFEELHDDMLALTPRGQELEFHVNLLRHGRRTCHAQRPRARVRAAADVPVVAEHRSRREPVDRPYLELTDPAGDPARARGTRRVVRVDPPDGAVNRAFYERVGADYAAGPTTRGRDDAWWQAHAERVETWVIAPARATPSCARWATTSRSPTSGCSPPSTAAARRRAARARAPARLRARLARLGPHLHRRRPARAGQLRGARPGPVHGGRAKICVSPTEI